VAPGGVDLVAGLVEQDGGHVTRARGLGLGDRGPGGIETTVGPGLVAGTTAEDERGRHGYTADRCGMSDHHDSLT